MLSFLSYLKEAKNALGHGSEKHGVMTIGRMQPPTAGHEKVVDKVHSVSKEHGAEHHVFLSGSHDTKDNPMSPADKVKHAKNAFPKTNISALAKGETPVHAAHHFQTKTGSQHLHVVVGSDRVKATNELLHKYNDVPGKHGHYNYKSITVHSSGERDEKAKGTAGVSGSKMREHAAAGNKKEFHANLSSKMKPEHKDALYSDLRKSMSK